MKAPDRPLEPQPVSMSCGNCCNAIKSSRSVGRVVCVAFPPHMVARPGGMASNSYPELAADKLGCTVFWNVNAQLFHILGQAVTLATQGEANPDGKNTHEKTPGSDAGSYGGTT